jgi:hypothetical protein
MAMPRFSLRTLIVVMLLGGPVSALGWQRWEWWREEESARREREAAARWYPAMDAKYQNGNFSSTDEARD